MFQRFPRLRVTLLEIGFAWLPVWLWRLDKDWKSLRREVPWLAEPPTEVTREHMRFSTAPIDASTPRVLADAVEWLGSENLLMFASDYPHQHDDDLATLLESMLQSMREKTMAANARTWYRL